MKRLIIKLLALSFMLTISISSFSQTDENMKAMVAKMNDEMMELLKAGRYEAMAKYYDINLISMPNYRVMEKGWQLILNNNLGRKKGGYQVADGKKTTTDLIIGEDMMVDIGQYTLTINFPGLEKPKVDNGKYMNVWRKSKDGSWRIVVETWNADKSPNAPAQPKPTMQPAGQPVKK
ncbi:MAG: DUF4440 domain-containing protein [Bacteroidales bacterium]|jgi:ketosteroid isomerase-like protein|nr:nuclear transport factor 2 family protein [Bacteroidales bacterium]MDX9906923.1 DUF4440 domain-containing protein [Bacteroidales bacterium]